MLPDWLSIDFKNKDKVNLGIKEKILLGIGKNLVIVGTVPVLEILLDFKGVVLLDI